MSRHRLPPARRVRPRYGRMAAAGLSVLVTMVALLGGIGLIPLQSSPPAAGQAPAAAEDRAGPTGTSGADTTTPPAGTSRSLADRADDGASVSQALREVAQPEPDNGMSSALPVGSGLGRRAVFSKSDQRVWLVDADGAVASTYLVSGSVTNNLRPGSYAVYSRSRRAVGVDDSGVMQYFVRFAHGPHAAIGFHTIPTKDGRPLQTEAQLGTPRSHGCIRQSLSDAVRMWDFADVGTAVVVVA